MLSHFCICVACECVDIMWRLRMLVVCMCVCVWVAMLAYKSREFVKWNQLKRRVLDSSGWVVPQSAGYNLWPGKLFTYAHMHTYRTHTCASHTYARAGGTRSVLCVHPTGINTRDDGNRTVRNFNIKVTCARMLLPLLLHGVSSLHRYRHRHREGVSKRERDSGADLRGRFCAILYVSAREH